MGLRINLGCGNVAPAGWVNIDRSPTLLVGRVPGLIPVLQRIGFMTSTTIEWPENIRIQNIRKGLSFDDGSAEAVYSSHTLEHLYLDEAMRVVQECWRVLQPGGLLRVALPDSEQIARTLANDQALKASMEFNEMLATYPTERPNWRTRLRLAVTASRHLWQPTRAIIVDLFERAGFDDVAEHSYRTGALPDLDVVEHREASIFIEGRKPGSTSPQRWVHENGWHGPNRS